jgi:hypothetical protein
MMSEETLPDEKRRDRRSRHLLTNEIRKILKHHKEIIK